MPPTEDTPSTSPGLWPFNATAVQVLQQEQEARRAQDIMDHMNAVGEEISAGATRRLAQALQGASMQTRPKLLQSGRRSVFKEAFNPSFPPGTLVVLERDAHGMVRNVRPAETEDFRTGGEIVSTYNTATISAAPLVADGADTTPLGALATELKMASELNDLRAENAVLRATIDGLRGQVQHLGEQLANRARQSYDDMDIVVTEECRVEVDNTLLKFLAGDRLCLNLPHTQDKPVLDASVIYAARAQGRVLRLLRPVVLRKPLTMPQRVFTEMIGLAEQHCMFPRQRAAAALGTANSNVNPLAPVVPGAHYSQDGVNWHPCHLTAPRNSTAPVADHAPSPAARAAERTFSFNSTPPNPMTGMHGYVGDDE